ncbi:hypothetical protein VTI74DRAFT_9940 [Chaetomium olivicolor]
MRPQVINDPVRHGQHHVPLSNRHLIDDGTVQRCVRAVGAQLPRAVEPVPLLGRLVDHLAGGRAHDHDLGITEVGYVEEGFIFAFLSFGALRAGAGLGIGSFAVAVSSAHAPAVVQLRASSRRRPQAVVRRAGRLDGLLIRALQVGDRVRVVRVGLARRVFKQGVGPEVEDQARP